MKDLNTYAEIVLTKGLALKPQEDLLINAPLEAAPFVEALTEVAYREFNSGTVHVNWQASALSKLKVKYGSDHVLGDVPNYVLARFDTAIKRQAALLNIVSHIPNLMGDVDPERMKKAAEQTTPKTRPFEQKMYQDLKWCAVAYPNAEWAKLIYPKLSEEDALKNLEEAIHHFMHLDEKDPLAHWDTVIEQVEKRRDLLNKKQYKALRFRSKETQLDVPLIEDHIWLGGRTPHKQGAYMQHLPSERLFTAPHKYGTNGTAQISEPLLLRGKLIRPFTVTFTDGKPTNVLAQDKQLVERLLNIDEGAGYLGKVALVDRRNKIAALGTKFFHTLFDENASTHLAFGHGHSLTLKDGRKLNREGLTERGLNQSRFHLDFAIGTPEMKIYGIKEDDEEELIMDKGHFVNDFA